MTNEPRDDTLPPTRRGSAASRWIETGEAVVGATLVVLIFVLILLQASQRYLPVDGWVWTGELARFGLVWLTFAMAGALLAGDEHITLQVIDYVANGRLLQGVKIFASLVVAATCLVFAYEAYVLITEESGQTSPALQMPLRWLYLIPLAGLLLTALRALLQAFAGGITGSMLGTEHLDQSDERATS